MPSPNRTRNLRSLLFICQGYPPFHGGAEQATAVLAEAAAGDPECRVHVLTSDIGGRLEPEEVRNGVRILRVPSRKRDWTHHSVPELVTFYASCRRRLPALQESLKPSTLLAHFTMPAGLIALTWRRRFGAPYSVVLHGADVPGHEPARFRLLHPLMKVVARRVWNRADHVIAVSGELAALAQRTWPRGRIDVIPNGVDTTRFCPATRPEQADRTRVVLLSRLVEIKGVHVLIEALAGLPRPLLRTCRIDVYGTGPQRPALEALVRRERLTECVTFHGVVPADRVPSLLREADLFVLPSLREAAPVSLLEAMATGLPAIATSVGDVPHVVRDGANGRLVPPADPEALGRALGELLKDRDRRERMGRAARETACTYASDAIWKRYAERLWGTPEDSRQCE